MSAFAPFLRVPFLVLALAVAARCAAAATERPRNVGLIFVDDLGYADLGCYGARDIRTPHLDRMAAEGSRFTSFYVAHAVVTAQRAALLTAVYPNRVGLGGALDCTSTTGIHPDEPLLGASRCRVMRSDGRDLTRNDSPRPSAIR